MDLPIILQKSIIWFGLFEFALPLNKELPLQKEMMCRCPWVQILLIFVEKVKERCIKSIYGKKVIKIALKTNMYTALKVEQYAVLHPCV